MPTTADHLDEVAAIVKALTVLGLEPVLVGGMVHRRSTDRLI